MKARSAQGATTLPGRYYTSDELFETELERIFRGAWLYAGHVSRLPRDGSYFLFSIGAESLVVLREPGGEIRAFFNVCRHRGTRLCEAPEGRFAGGIQCPYHAWTYGLDGALRSAPNMDDVAGFSRAEHGLHAAPVAVFEGLIFVRASRGGLAFADAFAPLAGKFAAWGIDRLRSVHTTVYDVAANWKLLFQNYSECYHCPSVHPALNRLTPYRDSTNDLEDGPFLGGPMKLVHGAGGSMTMSGAACAPPLGDVEGADLERVYYYTIFPNLFLSLHPDYVLVHRGEPLVADLTRIHCDWHFHPDAIEREGFDPSDAIDFWDMTNRQDWRLCELSQQGVASRAYTPGPYSDLESQLAAFDRHYLKALGEDP